MKGAALIFLLAVGPALTGQANPLTVPPMAVNVASQPARVVRFNPPVEITIKQRVVVRCRMLSFDAKTVQIQTRRGKIIPYATAQIRTRRTRDGMFSWQSESETFETARKNAALFQAGLPTAGRPRRSSLGPERIWFLVPDGSVR